MRRLAADAQQMRTEFAGHPQIDVTPLGFEPAEAYRVTYRLTGVALDPQGQPEYVHVHHVHVQLPATYPRSKPLFRMETPIFHPNFGSRVGEEVCIGDYWSPAQSLADIVVTIGEMIQYQRYNVRSPLNAVAARWVAENESVFPVGAVPLFQAEPEISVGTRSGGEASVPTKIAVGSVGDPDGHARSGTGGRCESAPGTSRSADAGSAARAAAGSADAESEHR